MNRTDSILVLFAAAIASASPAQNPTTTDVPALTLPLHRTDNGELWAVGDDYKVSFHAGFHFTPYLGEAFATNQDFAWRTRSIRLGDRELLEGRQAVPDARQTVCDFHLGDAIVERYLLSPAGVEQTFVFRSLPEGGGALVIEGEVRTPTSTGFRGPEHGPIHFRASDGTHVLTYGAAFAIDAAGDRLAIATDWDDKGAIRLIVPGEWLRHAAFPVTVDPLVGAVTVATGNTVQDTDVCVHETLGVTFIAYSRLASASDGDVYLRRLAGPALGSGTLVFSEIGAAADARRPALALNPGVSRASMVYQRRVGQGDTGLAVHVRLVSNTALLGSFATLSPPAGVHWTFPDIGGQTGGVDGRAMLVFLADVGNPSTDRTDVFGLTFDTVLGQAIGSAFRLSSQASSSAGADRNRVRINQANGGSGDGWLAVYQDITATISNDDWDVIAVRVLPDSGVASSLRWTTVGRADWHKLNPFVDGRNGDYRIAYAMLPVTGNEQTPTSLGTEIWSARLRWDIGGSPVLRSEGFSFRPPRLGQVALHGIMVDRQLAEFAAVAYVDRSSGAMRANVLGGAGESVHDELVRSGSMHYAVSIGASASPRRFPIVGSINDNAGAVFLDALLHHELPAVTPSGSGCGSGVLAAVGEHRIGNGTFGLRLEGANPHGLALFVFALRSANVPLAPFGMPGCTALVDIVDPLAFVSAPVDATGLAVLPLSLSTRPALAAIDLWVQGAYVVPFANAAGTLVTQALRLPLR